MAFDPRCVAYEGRLQADHCTAEYIGRGNHDADAACFRSRHPVGFCASSRMFYFETRILATLPPSSVPPQRASSALALRATTDHAIHDETTPNVQEDLDPEVRNTNLVHHPLLSHEGRAHTMFSQNPRLRHFTRHRTLRPSEKKRFHHQVAVGFIIDEIEQMPHVTTSIGTNGTRKPSGNLKKSRKTDGFNEANERAANINTTPPTIDHRNLGENVNSLAYVGKSGTVLASGHQVLQCERYGAGDVVGCGILWDTHTFFFTCNGTLVGKVAARDVPDLDPFEQIDTRDENECWSDFESDDDDEFNDWTEMKALYPAVSLHGIGECVQGVFEKHAFRFDVQEFETQVHSDRQRLLHIESEQQETQSVSSKLEEAELTVEDFVQEYLVFHGYESAYVALKGAQAPRKRPLQSINCVHESKNVVSSVEANCSEFTTISSDGRPLNPVLLETLNFRHHVRELIQCFQTAQALELIQQYGNQLNSQLKDFETIRFNCHLLCVVDELTRPSMIQARENESKKMKTKTWNPESAIAVARRVFRDDSRPQKHQRHVHGSRLKDDQDIAAVMSLLLYDQRERVPLTWRGQFFLTSAFRESVIDHVNRFLLERTDLVGPQGSNFETFLCRLETLQHECLNHGCHVYPEDPNDLTTEIRKMPCRRASMSSSFEDSSSSLSELEDQVHENDMQA